jgi:outer membrane protein assembly factor BamB
MTETKRPLKVFLCHAHADRDAVRTLYNRLIKDGVDAWFDKEKLLPGQDWELEIRKAVREADVVVVCLSKQFNQAGFRQKEVRLALDTAMEKPEGEIFIIPARLEECDTLESLRRWHWVDLFEDDGYEMLMRALRARADKIGATLQIKKSWLPKVNTQPVAVKKPSSPIEKPVEKKQEKPKPKKEILKPKTFNKAIIGMVGFIVLALVAVFVLRPLLGKQDPIPTATSTNRLGNITPTFENNTPLASFTPTQSQTPSPIPSFTATFEPRSINWNGTQVSWSGQPISADNVAQLKEIGKLQVGIYEWYEPSVADEIVVSRDGKLITYGVGKVIYVRQIEHNTVIKTLAHPHNINCFDVSSDGRLLASINNSELRIWDIGNNSLLYNLSIQQDETRCPIAFSPDGSLLASAGSKGIYIRQVSDGTLLKVLNDQVDSSDPIFSSDGTLLAGNGNGKIYIWNVKGWTLLHTFQDGGPYVFSPDSSLLATASNETISIWRVDDWSLTQTLKDTSSPNLGITSPLFFLPNGQVLVSGLFDGAIWAEKKARLWRVSDGVPIKDIDINEYIDSGIALDDGSAIFFLSEGYSSAFIHAFSIMP